MVYIVLYDFQERKNMLKINHININLSLVFYNAAADAFTALINEKEIFLWRVGAI